MPLASDQGNPGAPWGYAMIFLHNQFPSHTRSVTLSLCFFLLSLQTPSVNQFESLPIYAFVS